MCLWDLLLKLFPAVAVLVSLQLFVLACAGGEAVAPARSRSRRGRSPWHGHGHRALWSDGRRVHMHPNTRALDGSVALCVKRRIGALWGLAEWSGGVGRDGTGPCTAARKGAAARRPSRRRLLPLETIVSPFAALEKSGDSSIQKHQQWGRKHTKKNISHSCPASLDAH